MSLQVRVILFMAVLVGVAFAAPPCSTTNWPLLAGVVAYLVLLLPALRGRIDRPGSSEDPNRPS